MTAASTAHATQVRAERINLAVGEAIRQARIRAGLTLAQVEQRIGHRAAFLALMERGLVPPTPSVLALIAEAVGVHPGSLYPAPLFPRAPMEGAVPGLREAAEIIELLPDLSAAQLAWLAVVVRRVADTRGPRADTLGRGEIVVLHRHADNPVPLDMRQLASVPAE